MSGIEEVDEVVARLRDAYRDKMRAALPKLYAWRDTGTAEAGFDIAQLVHGLSGSAAVFGFAAVSETAGPLEDHLLALKEGLTVDSVMEASVALIERLCRAIEDALAESG